MTGIMKAVWYRQNGSAADVLEHGELPVPNPAPGQVLVRLYSSGVNPSDVKSRAGSRPMGFDLVIPHSDGAGVIEAVGEGADAAMVGRRVYLRNGQWQRAFGTAAQYIALDAGCVHDLPDDVSFETGAALGIPALTAAYAVLKDGPVDGETILIQGGGGTVARLAIQIAIGCGARVIATTGDLSTADRIAAAGASAVLDYHDPDLPKAVHAASDGRPVTRLIDAEVGTNIAANIDILATKGTMVGYGSARQPVAELPFLKMMFKNITLSSILVYLLEPDEAAAYAAVIEDMLARGVLDVPVGEVLALSQAAHAHELVETNARKGTVVLTMD